MLYLVGKKVTGRVFLDVGCHGHAFQGEAGIRLQVSAVSGSTFTSQPQGWWTRAAGCGLIKPRLDTAVPPGPRGTTPLPHHIWKWRNLRIAANGCPAPPPRASVGRGAEGEKVTQDYLGPESGSRSLEVHQVTAMSSYGHGHVSLCPNSCDHLVHGQPSRPALLTVSVTLLGEGLDPVSHLLLFGASFGWDVKLALCHARAGCVH